MDYWLNIDLREDLCWLHKVKCRCVRTYVKTFKSLSSRALVVLVSRGHGEGERHLRLDAACGVHPVSEDEVALASAYTGFGVALAGAIVRGSVSCRRLRGCCRRR